MKFQLASLTNRICDNRDCAETTKVIFRHGRNEVNLCYLHSKKHVEKQIADLRKLASSFYEYSEREE